MNMPGTPQSPPKRMTRARAKAVEEKQASLKTTKITTPAAKAAAQGNKRKTRADDDVLSAEPSKPRDSMAAQSTLSSAAKAQPRKAKATDNSKQIAPKVTRNTVGKNPLASEPKSTSATGRSTAPTTRMTRARAGSVNADPTATQARTARKKVTFQDEKDANKENVELQTDSKGKKPPAKSQRGVKSTPDRSSASSRGAARVAHVSGTRSGMIETQDTFPLSPKKGTQVAKGTQIIESGATGAQPKHLQRSPVKAPGFETQHQPNHTREGTGDLSGSIDELQLPQSDLTSPSNKSAASMMASPAKRPPPSPFKDGMKNTPRRHGAPDARQLDLHKMAQEESLICKSPKKIALPESPSEQAADKISRDLQASLLKSPAKRPPSPLKCFSPVKTLERKKGDGAQPSPSHSSGISGSPRKPGALTHAAASSPLKANRPLEFTPKVHKLTVEEQQHMLDDELFNAPAIFSPVNSMPSMLELYKSAESCGEAVGASTTSKTEEHTYTARPSRFHSGGDLVIACLGEPLSQERGDIPAKSALAVPEGGMFTISSRAANLSSEDDSEDELQSSDIRYQTSPSPTRKTRTVDTKTPTRANLENTQSRTSLGMTVLAQRFGEWQAATPDTRLAEQRKVERSLFSPVKPSTQNPAEADWTLLEQSPRVDMGGDDQLARNASTSPLPLNANMDVPQDHSMEPDLSSPLQPSYFEEAMAIREDNDDIVMHDVFDTHHEDDGGEDQSKDFFRQSQISDASQEYGDENAIPVDPALLEPPEIHTNACTPVRVFSLQPKVIHTVSKVPLKPAADFGSSPLIKPGRRTHSLSATLSPRAEFDLHALRQINPHTDDSNRGASQYPANGSYSSKFSESLPGGLNTPSKPFDPEMQTPHVKGNSWSVAGTPARTPRADLNTRLLSGAVVYVDVHTTEGADASGIFIELLGQMGAKCVKSWNWNPRESVVNDSTSADDEDFANGKVGITHVVFKDGGKRTMEKVREAKGLVLCVGVGWVLDCERENKWLDEAEYAIDTSTIPRGGHRRRKSMEPKLLSRENASIFTSESPNKPNLADISPTKEFLQLSSPAGRRQTVSGPAADRRVSFAPLPEQSAPATPSTPGACGAGVDGNVGFTPASNVYAESDFGSPTTPYFLHPGQLVQQTCPPKQTQQLLFPVTGRIDDQPNETIRQRLLQARRKSLQWAPRVGSPLAKTD